MTSLWQAIAIIMAVSLVSLGMRAGAVVAISIPLTLAIVFPIMQMAGIDLQRISLGALIIALGLLVDDAMTTVDVMTSRLALATTRRRRRATPMTCVADAHRLIRLGRRFRADRPREKLGWRIHVFDLRGGVDRPDRLLVRRRPVHAADRRAFAHEARRPGRRAGRSRAARFPHASCHRDAPRNG